jgi:hypothetical protein
VEELLDRCPHCRGGVRPGAPWCTQCWADLRPAPEPAPAPEPVLAVAAVPAAAPASVPARSPVSAGDATWPCAACGTGNPIAASTCASCGSGFLAGLRDAEGPLLELPGVGDLTRMSRGQRMLLAFGVVLVFVALTALLGLLLS